MKQEDEVVIKRIDLVCKIADVKVNSISYEIDFDIMGTDVLVTPESIQKVKAKGKRWWIANAIEKEIRGSQDFQDHCSIFE